MYMNVFFFYFRSDEVEEKLEQNLEIRGRSAFSQVMNGSCRCARHSLRLRRQRWQGTVLPDQHSRPRPPTDCVQDYIFLLFEVCCSLFYSSCLLRCISFFLIILSQNLLPDLCFPLFYQLETYALSSTKGYIFF